MDLITRLLLNTQNFDTNLQSSTKLIRQFELKVNSAKGSIGNIVGAFGKFVPLVAAVTTALGAFKMVIGESQTLTDGFERAITQAKSSCDLFFSAIAAGDISIFTSNLKELTKVAGLFADIMDDLGTFNIFKAPQLAEIEREMSKAKFNIKAGIDVESNQALLTKLEGDWERVMLQSVDKNTDAYYAGLRKALKEKGYKGDLSNEFLDEVFGTYDSYSAFDAVFQKMQKNSKAYNKTRYANYRAIHNLGDDTLTSLFGFRTAKAREEQQYWDRKTANLKLLNVETNKTATTTAKAVKNETKEYTLLQKLQQELDELNKIIENGEKLTEQLLQRYRDIAKEIEGIKQYQSSILTVAADDTTIAGIEQLIKQKEFEIDHLTIGSDAMQKALDELDVLKIKKLGITSTSGYFKGNNGSNNYLTGLRDIWDREAHINDDNMSLKQRQQLYKQFVDLDSRRISLLQRQIDLQTLLDAMQVYQSELYTLTKDADSIPLDDLVKRANLLKQLREVLDQVIEALKEFPQRVEAILRSEKISDVWRTVYGDKLYESFGEYSEEAQNLIKLALLEGVSIRDVYSGLDRLDKARNAELILMGSPERYNDSEMFLNNLINRATLQDTLTALSLYRTELFRVVEDTDNYIKNSQKALFDSTYGGIKGIYSAGKAIDDAFKNGKLVDQIFAITDAMYDLVNIVDQVSTSIEAYKSISKTFTTLVNAETAAETANTAAKVANTTATATGTAADDVYYANKAAGTAVTNVDTTANLANAASKIFSAHSWIPFVGVAIAGGLIGMMLSKMGVFANGGIVGGNSFAGDHNIVRVNSGEMILNRQQLANLFSMINSGSAYGGGGQVQFRISGLDLVGTLNNYNSARRKL